MNDYRKFYLRTKNLLKKSISIYILFFLVKSEEYADTVKVVYRILIYKDKISSDFIFIPYSNGLVIWLLKY